MNYIDVKHKNSLSKNTAYYNIFKKVLFFLAYTLPILTLSKGIVSPTVSIIMLFIMVVLFADNEFYLLFPVLLFFYAFLIAPGGIVVYRIYTILFIIKVILKNQLTIQHNYIVFFIIVAFYGLLVIAPNNFRLAISTTFDMLFVVFYLSSIQKINNWIKHFFRFMTFAGIASSIFGLVNKGMHANGYILMNNEWIEISRAMGTFEDPNYLGFFINIIIFANLLMPLFKTKTIRALVILFLYYSLLASISITGLLCNLGGLLLYIIIVKKLRLKYIVLCAICLIIIIFGYQYSLNNDIAYLSDISNRIKSMTYLGNDYTSITSNRTVLWNNNWEIFKGQPICRILFGGNRISPISYDEKIFVGVSHQEYIDLLLNLGLIGFVIIISLYIYSISWYWNKYKSGNGYSNVVILFVKYIWFFYSFGLSMFLDSRFMIFFLV